MPPRLLQVFREPLRPGVRAYDAIEREILRQAIELGCPHPYLAAESLTGPHEVWWFNGYDSQQEADEVYAAYARNEALMAALQQSSEQKAPLTLPPINAMADYRAELSVAEPWELGSGRFLLIAASRDPPDAKGTIFEARDGTCFVVAAFQTFNDASSAVKTFAEAADVFGVRPEWSFADDVWVSHDPEFWRATTG
jgi:hypothetical protein